MGIENISKDIWPYTFFTDIKDIANMKEFPPITVFTRKGNDHLKEFEDQCISLMANGRANTLGECLTFFGIPTEDFSQIELNATLFDNLGRLEEQMKISPEVYFKY